MASATVSLDTFNSLTNHKEACYGSSERLLQTPKTNWAQTVTVHIVIFESLTAQVNCDGLEMQAHVMTTTFADEVADILESEGRVFFQNPWGATRVLAEVGSVDGVTMYEVRKVELTTQESKWVGRYKIENGKKVKVGMATETSTKITGVIRWNGDRQHTLATALTELSDRKYAIKD